MDSLEIHPPTRSEPPAPKEGSATPDFGRERSIHMEMEADIRQYPWESPPAMTRFVLAKPSLAAPAPVVAAMTSQRRVAEGYVRRVRSKLPDGVRESFEKGAGMFDAPPTPDDGLDGLFR